jgi:TATA-binding protein-associated factor Taf7
MHRHIGKKVYTVGKKKRTRGQWGVIIKIGDERHFVVLYDNKKYGTYINWINKDEILFWG